MYLKVIYIKKLKKEPKLKIMEISHLLIKLREELLSKGIIIEDQKGKTIWKIK